jgi:hypothetical protein
VPKEGCDCPGRLRDAHWLFRKAASFVTAWTVADERHLDAHVPGQRSCERAFYTNACSIDNAWIAVSNVDHHRGGLCNRIDGRTTFDDADVKRRGWSGRQCPLAGLDQGMNGTAAPSVAPRMTAGAGELCPQAHRGDTTDCEAIDAMPFDSDQRPNGLRVQQRRDAAEIAEPLLANGGCKQHGAGRQCLCQLARDVQHRSDSERVIADTRTRQANAIANDRDRREIRKDGVEVSDQGECRPVAADTRDDIARRVNLCREAGCSE